MTFCISGISLLFSSIRVEERLIPHSVDITLNSLRLRLSLIKELLAKEGQYFKETENTTYATITREYFITDDLSWFEGVSFPSAAITSLI